MQVVVGVDLTILRQAFIAVCKKSTREEEKDKKRFNVMEMLFSPKLGSTPQDIKIGEIANELNGLIDKFTGKKDTFKNDDFQNQLKALNTDTSWIEDVTIRIDQAFLYKRSETLQNDSSNAGNDPNPDDPNPDDPKSDDPELRNEFCYAFQLTINAPKMIKEINSFSVDGLTFAVWDCSYPNVLEKLNIVDISKYIQ